jgi:hypothetical protein
VHRLIWRTWDRPEPGPADTAGPVGSAAAGQTGS